MKVRDKAKQRESQQRHYFANREAEIAKAKLRTAANRKRLREYIRQAKNQPCGDCGVSYPWYVMEYHHVGEKDCEVSNMITRNVSLARL